MEKKLINVRKRISSFMGNEYHCEITDKLDEFKDDRDIDIDYINITKTYMLPPDKFDNGNMLIPIRVPGATRGHIEVIPFNGYWEVVEVILYPSTAIIGTDSKCGCYKPEVLSILDEFEGILINFEGYNPSN